jgi:hypothetical protein
MGKTMITRKLLWGALMLCAGAAFTFCLGAAMQGNATLNTQSYQPGGPPSVATDKRNDQEWMF